MKTNKIFSDSSAIALVVTTINQPGDIMKELALGCMREGWSFYVVGDKKGPSDFRLEGAKFYSLESQLDLKFEFSKLCPTGHYARKNIGYLAAIADGAQVIIETDDDNMPLEQFWDSRVRISMAKSAQKTGWVNAYKFFSNSLIWPRGFPLNLAGTAVESYEDLNFAEADCPVQQGLADDNPDIDAIYRLLLPLPHYFSSSRKIILPAGAWCPFNSQNTTWWEDAFPLLYLPAYCSFRMTDIWRSFIAQRVAWECNWSILFESPTVRQERNDHDLMKDFEDEIPGYLNNRIIIELFENIKLEKGVQSIQENMLKCYEVLIRNNIVGQEEIPLLESWFNDLDHIRSQRTKNI